MSRSSALFVWGGWEGHEPRQGAAIVRTMLEAEGFDVRVETETSVFLDPAIRSIDLILKHLSEAVAEGKALVPPPPEAKEKTPGPAPVPNL